MGYLGLEPRTYRLKAEYSTIELATRIYFTTGVHTTFVSRRSITRICLADCFLIFPTLAEIFVYELNPFSYSKHFGCKSTFCSLRYYGSFNNYNLKKKKYQLFLINVFFASATLLQ
jgi:hypothetical protein